MPSFLIQAVSPGAAVTRDGLMIATDVALVLLGAGAAVTVVAMLVLLVQVRRVGRSLRDVVQGLEKKADPLIERGRVIAANVEYISAAVRTDVERLNASVKALSDRLQQASDHMEARIDEFNALMEVVQSEAEDVFIDTASTVRGLRAGASNLTAPVLQPDEGEPDAEPSAEPEG
jgi:uncharacterized protein YoxC